MSGKWSGGRGTDVVGIFVVQCGVQHHSNVQKPFSNLENAEMEPKGALGGVQTN